MMQDGQALTPEQEAELRHERLREYVRLDTKRKALAEEQEKLKEVIKLDMISGAKYEDDQNYLVLSDPIKTVYNMQAFRERFGVDFTLGVSKIQNAEVDKRIKKGEVKLEQLGGTFHTEPGSPSLRIYEKGEQNGAS